MTGSLGPLLLLNAGINVLNLALSLVLWRRGRTPLHRSLVLVWASSAFTSVIQALPAPNALLMVFAFVSCYPVGLALVDRLPVSWIQAALEGLPGQPAGGHGAQHAGLCGQRPVLDGGDALGHRCCATPPPRSDPGIASPGLRADHHRQGDCSQLRSLWPTPARLSLPSRPTTPGADRVCPRAAGHLRGFDHGSGRRAGNESPRSARRSTSSTASSGSSLPTSRTSCARRSP